MKKMFLNKAIVSYANFVKQVVIKKDNEKVVSIKEIQDKKGNIIKAEYTTDSGNTMVATHELRLMKLLTYVKNKKLPFTIVVE